MTLPRPTRHVSQDTETGIATPVTQTVHRAKPTQYKPSDVFFFEPAVDITAPELADLFKLFFNGIMLHHEVFSKLPEPLKRHFEHKKTI